MDNSAGNEPPSSVHVVASRANRLLFLVSHRRRDPLVGFGPREHNHDLQWAAFQPCLPARLI